MAEMPCLAPDTPSGMATIKEAIAGEQNFMVYDVGAGDGVPVIVPDVRARKVIRKGCRAEKCHARQFIARFEKHPPEWKCESQDNLSLELRGTRLSGMLC